MHVVQNGWLILNCIKVHPTRSSYWVSDASKWNSHWNSLVIISFSWRSCGYTVHFWVRKSRESGGNVGLNNYLLLKRPVTATHNLKQVKSWKNYLWKLTNFANSQNGKVKHWFSLGNETWVHNYTPKLKIQSLVYHHPNSLRKKIQCLTFYWKMQCAFFQDYTGNFYQE